jgi:sigma-E factor negative regulatory protein RseA
MSEFGNQNQQDRLSATIDSELSDLEMLSISHKLSKDKDLRETMVRYQMISDSMRGEGINLSALNLVSSVSQRLEMEPTVLAPVKSRTQLHKWVQPAAGAALAASVAAVGIMLGPQFINGTQQNAPLNSGLQVVAQPVGNVSPMPASVAQKEEHWKTVEGKTRTRLDGYLEQHSQYAAAPGGVQGVMPYTSFVSYGQPRK